MTLSLQVAMWSASVIFVNGGFQAVTLFRLRKIEEMIGNGKPGVFVRREEHLGERVHDLEQPR